MTFPGLSFMMVNGRSLKHSPKIVKTTTSDGMSEGYVSFLLQRLRVQNCNLSIQIISVLHSIRS